MIRTGEEYRAGLRDGREIWIDGERVHDVAVNPAFKPVVDCKARMYDLAHDPAWAGIMCYNRHGEYFSTLLRPPTTKAHWREKWRAVDAYLKDIRGVLTRVGDETVGEMWSLLDGRENAERDRSALRRQYRPPRPAGWFWNRTPSTFRRTPIPRATARSARRTRTPT